MVDVDDLALREIGRGDVEAVAGVLVHKTDHQVHLPAGFQQLAEDRVIGIRAAGHRRHQVLEHVAGQGEFREDQQVHPVLRGLFGQGQVLFQVGLYIPKFGVDLSEGEFEFHFLGPSL